MYQYDINIGERIKGLRFKHNLSQVELAKKIGITRVALSNYERNIRQVNLEVINKIAKEFKISLTEFLEPELYKGLRQLEEVKKINDTEYNITINADQLEPVVDYRNLTCIKPTKKPTIKSHLESMLELLNLEGLYNTEIEIENLEKIVVNTIKYESYKKINNL